jgi:hypothetical protein
MPAGERSQAWYRELVSVLRSEWQPDSSWEAVVELRARLQEHLDALRARRGITPPLIRCPRCGATAPAAAPLISVRAILLALARYRIEPLESLGSAKAPGRGIAWHMASTLLVGGPETPAHLKAGRFLDADAAKD